MWSIDIVSIILVLVALSLLLILLNLTVSGIIALLTSITFKKTFLVGLWALVVPPLMIVYGVFIERNQFVVKEVQLSFTQLPKSFDGYRIVHISDIHSQSFISRPEVLRRAVDKINSLNPDLILFSGDLITITPDELDVTGPILSKLQSHDGVISVLGNHDYCMYMKGRRHPSVNRTALQILVEREQKMGWKILRNECRYINKHGDSIAIVGVENITPSRHFPSTGNLQDASAGTDSTFRILLSHDPQHWDIDSKARNFPLTLSGHTHACQFSLFGLTPACFTYRHYRGLYQDHQTNNKTPHYLYVNPGLGETLFPARIGVTPEITLITLH